MVKNRIDAIVDMLDPSDTLLDIGCDHGYTILKAFEAHKIKKAIASDIREIPLESAKKNLCNLPVVFKQTDGFLNIDEDFQSAVISGMGSHLICSILNHAPMKDVTYLLQPNDKEHLLRKYLMDQGYQIINEEVIFDKFYYVIFKVVRGHMHLTDQELYTGTFNKEGHHVYFKYKISVLTLLLEQVDDLRKEELETIIKYYQLYGENPY